LKRRPVERKAARNQAIGDCVELTAQKLDVKHDAFLFFLRGLRIERAQVGEELEDALVKMVCKRAAIKAGQVLSDIEMRELVRQLEECQSPRTCPHGRPTVIQLAAVELEKAFGRI